MDVLLNGTTEKKNELSFKMIDYRKKGFFEKSDLKELIESTIMVWSHLTGNQLSKIICIVSLGNRFFHHIFLYIFLQTIIYVFVLFKINEMKQTLVFNNNDNDHLI